MAYICLNIGIITYISHQKAPISTKKEKACTSSNTWEFPSWGKNMSIDIKYPPRSLPRALFITQELSNT